MKEMPNYFERVDYPMAIRLQKDGHVLYAISRVTPFFIIYFPDGDYLLSGLGITEFLCGKVRKYRPLYVFKRGLIYE